MRYNFAHHCLRVWLDDQRQRWELFRFAARRGVRYDGAASIGVSGYRFTCDRVQALLIVGDMRPLVRKVEKHP